MHTTKELIEDIKQGKLVILMDDEDRENEGDLVIAAEKVKEEHINFMAQFARGLICLPMSKQHCERLHLPLMVPLNNQSKFGTKFTVSIEAAAGVTTGISVPDRTHTIRVAANLNSKPEDLAQPGHIFPIMAQNGGVLVRSGHTEASCDLARLAGFSEMAVVCEILKEDGTMARRHDLELFAKKHNLKIGTIADLIRYRLEREQMVVERNRAPLPTEWGTFEVIHFENTQDKSKHLVLLFQTDKHSLPWIRIQSHDLLFDLPGMVQGHWDPNHLRWPLSKAMQAIVEHGNGAIVLLNSETSSYNIVEKVGMLNESNNAQMQPPSSIPDWRDIGIGSQIVSQLGYSRIAVLGSPKKLCGLSGFGLEVVEYLPYVTLASELYA
ncbi:MAG TPA: 3,4-dihydroxy-2-butanone-4-phosphate synthase [Gammaproteobacteria bacterium]|nr:3,4-dihydroxy-2-butanone-4-phosphate synthase [Gammaproteobacteria bacterium]